MGAAGRKPHDSSGKTDKSSPRHPYLSALRERLPSRENRTLEPLRQVAPPPKKKGAPKGPQRGVPGCGLGRPKGSKNRISGHLKKALLKSFDEVGGVEYLVALAFDCPEAYAGLIRTQLPKVVEAKVGLSVDELLAGVVEEADEEDGA